MSNVFPTLLPLFANLSLLSTTSLPNPAVSFIETASIPLTPEHHVRLHPHLNRPRQFRHCRCLTPIARIFSVIGGATDPNRAEFLSRGGHGAQPTRCLLLKLF